MTDKDWIDAEQRKPAQEDADRKGCVLAWHRYNGTMVTGWHQFTENSFFTHWQKAPEPPDGFPLWENPPGKAGPDTVTATEGKENKK